MFPCMVYGGRPGLGRHPDPGMGRNMRTLPLVIIFPAMIGTAKAVVADGPQAQTYSTMHTQVLPGAEPVF